MPPSNTNAPDDSLHRHNCRQTFQKTPPQPWEFLFYIPNPNHPLHDDEGLSAHFCLLLPDTYKQQQQQGGLCRHGSSSSSSSSSYRAVALITRKPRSSTKSRGYMVFRPHTAQCACKKTPGELETHVVDRQKSGTMIPSPSCQSYDRADAKNKGHFETWSWYDNSVIPIQAPKTVHVDCLHLMRPLTQPKFGLVLTPPGIEKLEQALKPFREMGKVMPTIRKMSQRFLTKPSTPERADAEVSSRG
ncbi:MAG: hypothetical protein Q9200_005932 [Gallowayella weberi]